MAKKLHFKSMDEFFENMNDERLDVLRTANAEKPSSIYELAKLLKRNPKSVMSDALSLEALGVLTLEKSGEGKQTKVRPVMNQKGVNVEISI